MFVKKPKVKKTYKYPLKEILHWYKVHKFRWPKAKQPIAFWIAEKVDLPVSTVTCILYALSLEWIIKRELIERTHLNRIREYIKSKETLPM